MSNELDEFWSPGTFDPTESWPANEQTLHQGGLDGIDPSYDSGHSALTGVIGFDPSDYLPSLLTREDVEPELPQWGPPFVKFVDGRITDLEKKVIKEIEKWQFQTVTLCKTVGLQTDGSGNINSSIGGAGILFETVPGFTLALHRISIKPSGSNFGSPFASAGYFEIRVNEDMVDGSQIGASPLPSYPIVKTWGTRDAIRIRDGEILKLFMASGPTNSQITVKIQGSYDRTIEG